ncbi:MAG TPA: low temperature requirement protein A [Solirubrobacteraceae bacterium]|jgi:low temperature requirement protein LtrA|nr:low temperature requirement protein A [Solirubrobacteraceae bacterium]
MSTTQADERAHHRRRFQGRDPDEGHRTATPLELLYDLTLVVTFGVAADELAHFVADDHLWAGISGFVFAAFAASWAWISYSWFASGYDTDDWLFRLATMVQMVGVIVVALGLPPMFESIDHGDALDNGVMVAGYVIMRAALVPLWALVARHDPERAPAARTYIAIIAIAQVGWLALAIAELPVGTAFALFLPLIALEMAGPFIAEGRARTPWHPHHIAERYGLLVIITLGEVILGTVAALNALVHGDAGWTVDAALLAVAGVGLTFGCWWMYFSMPWVEPLVRRPGRSSGFVFGYGHLAIFAPLAAMGAGVHVAAYALADEAEISATGVVLSVVIPFAIFALAFYVVYSTLMHTGDPFHVWLLAATAVVLGVAVALAAAGVSVPVCLLVVMLAPVVTVVGYETLGHRHVADAVQRL